MMLIEPFYHVFYLINLWKHLFCQNLRHFFVLHVSPTRCLFPLRNPNSFSAILISCLVRTIQKCLTFSFPQSFPSAQIFLSPHFIFADVSKFLSGTEFTLKVNVNIRLDLEIRVFRARRYEGSVSIHWSSRNWKCCH